MPATHHVDPEPLLPNGTNGYTNGTSHKLHKNKQDSTANPSLESLSPNPSLQVHPNRTVSLIPSPSLNPSETDCVVHVHANGICGSDLHIYHTGQIGDLHVTKPHCLGHEGAGRVVWAGSAVSHLKIGDRVAIEPGVPCHTCINCTTGEYNLCADVRFSGVPCEDGSIRRYHVHQARYLHKLPESIDWEAAALLEPLSVVIHALERSHVRLGEGVLIAGAGPIGLACAAAARASGAWPLVITDVDSDRLKFAEGFVEGIKAVQVSSGQTPEEVAKEVGKRFEELGSPLPRVSFECTGVAASVHTCVFATQRGGEVMVIGVGRSIMDGMPFMHASMAEVSFM